MGKHSSSSSRSRSNSRSRSIQYLNISSKSTIRSIREIEAEVLKDTQKEVQAIIIEMVRFFSLIISFSQTDIITIIFLIDLHLNTIPKIFKAGPIKLKTLPFLLPAMNHLKGNLYLKQCQSYFLIIIKEQMKPRTEEEVKQFRDKNHIFIRSSHRNLINPVISFSEVDIFPSCVQDEIIKSGFKGPTPIQSQSLPVLLEGNDLIGIAQTGSGKTLAFVLPAIVHILAQNNRRPGDGPGALILAPTRELTIQIFEQFQKFGARTRLNAACLYGGQDKYIQKSQLRRGADLIIACPGRLIDFLDEGVTNLRRVTYLVLDEADRMLDMGFEPQIRKIVKQIRNDRQTLLFSATWPKEVQNLALDFCQENPVHIQIGNVDLTTNKQINQKISFVKSSDKDLKQQIKYRLFSIKVSLCLVL